MGNGPGCQRTRANGLERYAPIAKRGTEQLHAAKFFLVGASGQCAFADENSNPEAGWDDGVLWDHDDTVPDEVIISIQVRRFAFWANHDAIADARVFVDDRAINHAVAPYPDGRL